MDKFTVQHDSTLDEFILFAEENGPPSVIKWLDRLPSREGTFDVPKDIQIALEDVLNDYRSYYQPKGIKIHG